jgi:hypothetical protein
MKRPEGRAPPGGSIDATGRVVTKSGRRAGGFVILAWMRPSAAVFS